MLILVNKFTCFIRIYYPGTTESEENDNIGRYQTGLNWITREGSIDGSTIVTFLEQSGSIDYRLLNWVGVIKTTREN